MSGYMQVYSQTDVYTLVPLSFGDNCYIVQLPVLVCVSGCYDTKKKYLHLAVSMQSRSCSERTQCKYAHFSPKYTTFILSHSLPLYTDHTGIWCNASHLLCVPTSSHLGLFPLSVRVAGFCLLLAKGLFPYHPFLSISSPSHSSKCGAASSHTHFQQWPLYCRCQIDVLTYILQLCCTSASCCH